MAPQSCLHLNLELVTVTLHGERDLVDGTELRTSRWGDFLDCPGGPNVNTGPLFRSQGRRGVTGRADSPSEVQTQVTIVLAKRNGPPPRTVGSLQKLENQGKRGDTALLPSWF